MTSEDLSKIISMAIKIAAWPPMAKSEFASEAKVPWSMIQELRETLESAGYDWGKIYDIYHPKKAKSSKRPRLGP